ncbi:MULTISPECIES: LPS translocon maturation chaperone LptM [unclassified Acidovorax]|uniref:LPS translocon maturation chaperone LptM n=1 Tax=unclassified Acidovorax TaxID=2684926 RepID=UPI00288305A0|nr:MULTISPECIES: lipoprotein [unclassified Acidovorax]
MLRASQILVRTIALAASAAAVAGCGQRGPLFLPTEPAAAQRATLPQTLNPFLQEQQQPAAPGSAQAAPAPFAPASSALPSKP